MANKNTETDADIKKTSAATKAAIKSTEDYTSDLNKLNSQMKEMQFNEVVTGLKKSQDSMESLSKLGSLLKSQFSQAAKSISSCFNAGAAAAKVISETKEALSELKEVDTYLTEISKINSSLSKSELTQIGDNSFDIASKYGKSATDYLSSLQKMSRAGYENADSMAELSIAIQSTGDITADLANQYIIAADEAYKMNGSISSLRDTLDGANSITNLNSVEMAELAQAMSIAGSQAAKSQVEIDEATAALGTMISVTQMSGLEMGNAFKGILMNLQQISGTAGDGGDIIDESSLSQYEKACAELGVSLSEVKNGAVSLKEPMQILKELSVEYSKLDESDSRRENLLSSVGGQDRAAALNAILENYDLYEKMLQDYANGAGSMATEAEMTVNSWENSLNRLSNTWTDTVGNIANSGAVVTGINALNSLLEVINAITGALGSLGSIAVGAGLFAGIKNVGRDKMYSLLFV